ncbi:hypothetical protein NFJ02_26g59530 [Pycnococcus provasolii]
MRTHASLDTHRRSAHAHAQTRRRAGNAFRRRRSLTANAVERSDVSESNEETALTERDSHENGHDTHNSSSSSSSSTTTTTSSSFATKAQHIQGVLQTKIWPVLKRALPGAYIFAAAYALVYALISFAGSQLVTQKYVARAAAHASAATGRTVKLGRVCGAGMSRALPYVRVGPVYVSAADHERSSAHVREIRIFIRPLASLLQWRWVFALELRELLVHAVQAENSSWLGVPDDTSPISSRNFVPFLGAPVTPDMLPESLREREVQRARAQAWDSQWRDSPRADGANAVVATAMRRFGESLTQHLGTQCTLGSINAKDALVKAYVFGEPAHIPRILRNVQVRADIHAARDGAVDVVCDVVARAGRSR